ncbi:putative integral membrane protein conserved region-domain-containing protein [Rhizophagus clarus]|nr:putative integral membrane protein conserved region-domain-containing protein [Rhizophagus clarus]
MAINNDCSNTNYYLFCDTGVEKEDWYFALQRSSKLESNDNSTDKQINKDKSLFDSFAMNYLLKTLYSNDDHLQTQWLNAILGRIFLSVYKTQAIKDYFIRKLVRKIKKVRKPGFLSDIQIKSVDVGDGIPYITNPELVKLSPGGDLDVDISLNYTGGFRVEIETEAIISVGVKTIKVPLVLAVVLRGLQGKMLLRVKSPPTNRLWMGFHEMPKLDLLIEPIVSETQLKFAPIIKTIESKIHEMIMDSLVLPNMDDTSFFNSFGMGGIYEGEVEQPKQQKETPVETPPSTPSTPPTPPSVLLPTDPEKETPKSTEEENVVADIQSTLTTNEEVLRVVTSSPARLESTKSDAKVEVSVPTITTAVTSNVTENNNRSWSSTATTKLKSAFSEPNLLKTNTSRFRSLSKQFMKQRIDDSSSAIVKETVKEPAKEHTKESNGENNLSPSNSSNSSNNSAQTTTSSTSTFRRWSQVNIQQIRRRTGIGGILNQASNSNSNSNNNSNDNNNDNNNKNTNITSNNQTNNKTTSNTSTSSSTSNNTENDAQKSQDSSPDSIPITLSTDSVNPVDSVDNRSPSMIIENFAPLSASPKNISPLNISPISAVSPTVTTVTTTPTKSTSTEYLTLPTSSLSHSTIQNDMPKTTTPTPPPSPPKSPKESPNVHINSPHSPPHTPPHSAKSTKSTSSHNRDSFLSENNSLHDDDEFFPEVTPSILNTPVEELNRVLAKDTVK